MSRMLWDAAVMAAVSVGLLGVLLLAMVVSLGSLFSRPARQH